MRPGLTAVLLVLLSACSVPEGPGADGAGTAPAEEVDGADRYPEALRASIERLKSEVAAAPTDAGSIAERSRILSQWVDAHALAGADGAPFATTVLRNAVAAPTGRALAARAAEVDALVREYQLRDEEPEALGSLSAESLGPFTAAGYDTIRQTWTAGSRGLQPGGGFWIARHFSTLYGSYQTDDPGGPGYLTISSSSEGAVFAESEVVTLIHDKTPREDIARAVLDAIASRIISMIRKVGFEKDVALIGGVARNIGFVEAMKRGLESDVYVPEEPEYVGALGAALAAAG